MSELTEQTDLVEPSKVEHRETRTFTFEMRDAADGDTGNSLAGYAVVYDSPSVDLGGFIEVVRPSAFKGIAPDADIKCLYSHEAWAVLGRTPRTLKLTNDDQGLHFELDVPDTTHGRDVVELVRRGDVTQCSFGFVCLQDNWVDRGEDQLPLRELLSVELLEISIVAFAAYLNTSVSLRTMPHDLYQRHFDKWFGESRALLAEIDRVIEKHTLLDQIRNASEKRSYRSR